MQQIKISSGTVELIADLLDTPTARAILDKLPISSLARTWGEEVYFEVPVTAPKENTARNVVQAGELAFWVEGACIAIGYGPTPISQGEEIRLAAKTNIWAITRDNVKQLAAVKPGDPITVEALSSQRRNSN